MCLFACSPWIRLSCHEGPKCACHCNGLEARTGVPFCKLSSLIVNRPLSETLVFPMGFQHFQQVVKLSSVDDPMHRTLNCKCKSEDAGPWHGHGLEREWARPATRFGTEMFIFTRFLKGISFPRWGKLFCLFYKQIWRSVCQTMSSPLELPAIA